MLSCPSYLKRVWHSRICFLFLNEMTHGSHSEWATWKSSQCLKNLVNPITKHSRNPHCILFLKNANTGNYPNKQNVKFRHKFPNLNAPTSFYKEKFTCSHICFLGSKCLCDFGSRSDYVQQPSVKHPVKPYPVTFLCLREQLFHSPAPTDRPNSTLRTFYFPSN